MTVAITLKVESYPTEETEYPMFAIFWNMYTNKWIGLKYGGNKKGKKIEFAWDTSDKKGAWYYTNHFNNKYYHLVGIYNHDKKISEIYINGSKKAASRLKKTQIIEFDGVKIGIRDELNLVRSGAFHGVIDEIRIYKRVLKSDEISLLYKDSRIK